MKSRPLLRLGLRGRMAVLLVLVSVSAVGVAGWLMLERQAAAIEQGIREQAVRTGEILATGMTSLVLRKQWAAVRELAEEALRARETDPVAPLAYLVVTGPDGAAIYRPGPERGPGLAPGLDAVLTGNLLAEPRIRQVVVAGPGGAPVLDVAVPCAIDGVDGKRRVYGALRLGFGLSGLARRVRAAAEAFGLAALAAVGIGLLVGSLGTRGMLASLRRMADVVGRIAAGDLSPRVKEGRGDEIGALARAIDRMADDLQKRELLKRYISSTAWDEIEQKGPMVAEGADAEMREVTVLFLDIRNYTSLSETYESREMVALLNEVFTVLLGVVDEFGGVLDKFIGDALLVVFYPGPEFDDPVRATYASFRMQEALEEFNHRRRFYGREAIRIGVGINTGMVLTGSVGSKARKDFTVIGDPVNVAARLQERSKAGKHTRVVLSEATYSLVRSLVEAVPMEGGKIRGKAEEVAAYEVVALRGLGAILEGLEAEDPKVREEAFQALGARGSPAVIPHLMRVLGGDNQAAVLKAIPLLARLGKERDGVHRFLHAMLASSPDPRVLATVVRALGQLGRAEDAGKLRGLLAHADPRVRANALEALDALGAELEYETARELLADAHPRVKSNAAVTLWKRGRGEVVTMLADMARRGEPRERGAAVFAMGELFAADSSRPAPADRDEALRRIRGDVVGYRTLAAALVERLADPDPGVAARALDAVVKARETTAVPALLSMVGGGLEAEALAAVARIGVPARVARLLASIRGRAAPSGPAPKSPGPRPGA